ncbi:hypothetical protein BKA83DRAFT_4482936 [Pisolithus microcarpus]|nr:hypothetical protein BKA83DRAFT_4482936 [Pisolithus microcarpus]
MAARNLMKLEVMVAVEDTWDEMENKELYQLAVQSRDIRQAISYPSIRDADLPALFRHENSDNSATTNARVTSHISSANNSARNCLSYGPNALGARRAALRRWGTAWRCPTKLWEAVEMDMGSWEKKESGEKNRGISSSRFTSEKSERFGPELRELGSKRGRGWENGVALVRNRSMEFRETSGGGRDVREGLGERGNKGNRAPSPEILQISSYSVFLQRMGDIFGCAGANATKNTSSERSRRVERESRFARGTTSKSDPTSTQYHLRKGWGVRLRPRDLLECAAHWRARPARICLSRGLVTASMQAVGQAAASGGDGSHGNESGGRGTHSNTNPYTYYCGLVDLRGANEKASAGGHGHESESGKEVGCERVDEGGPTRHHSSSGMRWVLEWGPGAVVLVLNDNSAFPLRVVHTTVVPRGYEAALTSGAGTNLVKPFGSAALGYPHPPRKKQNEYNRRGERLSEVGGGCTRDLLASRGPPQSRMSDLATDAIRIMSPRKRRSSSEGCWGKLEASEDENTEGKRARDRENANGECEGETEAGKPREHEQNRGYET